MTPIENALDVLEIMRRANYKPECIGGRCVAALEYLIGEVEKHPTPAALPAETFQCEESE